MLCIPSCLACNIIIFELYIIVATNEYEYNYCKNIILMTPPKQMAECDKKTVNLLEAWRIHKQVEHDDIT